MRKGIVLTYLLFCICILFFIEKCLKVGFLIFKWSNDPFPVDTTFVGGCFWLFRFLLLKFGSLKWGGVESSGVGIKVEKNFVGG